MQPPECGAAAYHPRWSWRGHPLVSLLLASCIGITWDRYWDPPRVAGWWWAAVATWLVWWLLWRRNHCVLSSGMLMLCVASSMGLWHHTYWNLYPARHVARYAAAQAIPIALRCRARTVPELTSLQPPQPLTTIPKGVTSRLLVRATHLRQASQWSWVTGDVEVSVDGHLLGVRPGDALQVFGHLSKLPEPLNPGEQDWGRAARSERIVCRLNVSYPDCVRVRKRAWVGRAGPASLLGPLRMAGLRQLDQYVGRPRSLLAGALLLGARDRLEQDQRDAFFHTGTIHLLAISGLHVGILAWAFFFVARYSLAPRTAALLLLMIFTFIYCGLTGMRTPVVRATILVQIVCLSLIWRRNTLVFNGLAAAALVVLILQPADLFRPGAQLSFLAVATLAWISRNQAPPSESPLDRLIRRARPWYRRAAIHLAAYLRRLAWAGLTIWLVTLPLVMWQFHLVSPAALGLNVVLLFPIAVGLLSGFGVLVLGWLAPPLARICGTVCDASLALVEVCVRQTHDWHGSYGWVAGSGGAWCLVFYGGLAALAFVPRLRPSRPWALALFLLWLTAPVARDLGRTALSGIQPLRCTFLAVGHGTCVVMEMPDGRVVLYDAGHMGLPKAGAQLISSYLWHRRIDHLDAIVISHADADHYNAIPELLRRFSVGTVFVSHVMFSNTSSGVDVLEGAIEKVQVPVVELKAGDRLRFGGATRIHLLHPPTLGVGGSDNANSLVLEVVHQGRRILLPGDLETPGLERVVASPPRDCDVLMAPHHGSLRSDPESFARWCRADYAVISSGQDAGRSRPQYEALARSGCQVLHTERDGAITVVVADGNLEIASFLGGKLPLVRLPDRIASPTTAQTLPDRHQARDLGQ